MRSSSPRSQKISWCDGECCRNREIIPSSHALPSFLFIFLFLCLFLGLSSGQPELSAPTIGTDQLIYACADNQVVAFQGNGSLAWSASMNQTCQKNVAPVIDFNGKVYAAADQTVVVVTPPSSASKGPTAADFFSMVPPSTLKSIGNFSSVISLAVTSWSSVLYINTGTGIHAFMLDGTPLWSTLVQFNGSVMKSPQSMGVCTDNVTDCAFYPSLAVDECDGSIYVARSDGWLYSYATWQPFLRWRYALSVGVSSLLKVVCGNNGRVYVTLVQHNTIYALSAELGTLIWQVKVGPLVKAGSTVAVDSSGFVSVGSIDGFLYVISPDGRMQKYLSKDVLSPLSIQTSPILDCSNEAIYIAQNKIASKTFGELNGTEAISFTQSWGLNIWMFVPSTGQVLWETQYPDLFPTTMLLNDINSYRITSEWIIALTASANLSRMSMCKTEEELHKITCRQFFASPKQHLGGASKQIISFAVSILVIFLFLMIMSLVLYYYWRKKQTVHRHRLCKLLMREKLRHPKASLLRRLKSYERKIEYLQASLEHEPQSLQIAEDLRSSLEGLYFVKRSLALFLSSSDSDGVSQDQHWMRRPSLPVAEASASITEARSPFSTFLSWVDSALEKVLGTVEPEDFSEELRMISSYNNEFVTEYGQEIETQPLRMPNNEGSSSQSNQTTTGENAASPNPLHAEKYRNPLYNRSRSVTPSPTQKRTVSFSPVNEIFEETDEREDENQSDSLTRKPTQRAVSFSPVNEESGRSSSTDYTCTSSSSEQSRSPSPIYKKSVSFSPVNDVFGGNWECSSNSSCSDSKS